MSDFEKKDIRVFWWGRHLPKEYAKYARLSKLTDKDYEKLKELKEIWEDTENEEISWGHQLKANEIDWGAQPVYK